ncbi:hypothetical protein [Paenibacillus sp. V4I5]|nr:hypothetical protein [Paenibacillus sp. V4I5]
MVRFPSMGESCLCRVRRRASVGYCTQTGWHRSYVHAAGTLMAGLIGWKFLIELVESNAAGMDSFGTVRFLGRRQNRHL